MERGGIGDRPGKLFARTGGMATVNQPSWISGESRSTNERDANHVIDMK
jgi:hypothetical protein